MTFSPGNTSGPFLPINQTFSEDDDQFLIQITNRYRDVARYLNVREIALYDLTELPTGEQWFNTANTQIKKDGFRLVINFGSLPNNTTKSVAHGITSISTVTFTHIYATANNPNTKFVPIPYVNVGTPADGIEIWVDTTNVNIKTTTANWTSYSAIVVLEYLKN